MPDCNVAELAIVVPNSRFNMQGGVCRTVTDCRQSNIIDVNGLASGIYMLDVRSGRTHKVFKMVVR